MESAKEPAKVVRKEGPDEVAPRQDVSVGQSPVRCPYCHDDIVPDVPGWVACQSCLARHHAPCWREAGGVCGACGSTRELVPKPGLSDGELARLVRHGRRQQAVAELRGRGLGEAQAQGFYEGATFMLGAGAPGPDRSLPVVFIAQAVLLAFCTLAALASAAVGALSGLGVMVAACLALLGFAVARRSAREALLALANAAAMALGPLTVVGFGIPPGAEAHPALLALGALVSGASFVVGLAGLQPGKVAAAPARERPVDPKAS